ncbi:hypothetical protein [Thiomicrorhabdus indica]|uniref:hypothetical protein n=1 Tax=Thiomicrorhabdus indica TaxID=2267253 RepID=UPI00102E081E|nr:hypothetical protein [Thiomicrorhabdus indica]
MESHSVDLKSVDIAIVKFSQLAKDARQNLIELQANRDAYEPEFYKLAVENNEDIIKFCQRKIKKLQKYQYEMYYPMR